MRRVIAICAALVVASAVAVVLLTGGEDRPVGDKEARDLLAQAVEAARSGDDDRLCKLAHSKLMCARFLRDAKQESMARPSEAPVILASRVVPAKKNSPEFRVLDLRITASGREPYDTQFPVLREEGVLGSLNAVYWYPTTWG